jgi:hypothetical protein
MVDCIGKETADHIGPAVCHAPDRHTSYLLFFGVPDVLLVSFDLIVLGTVERKAVPLRKSPKTPQEIEILHYYLPRSGDINNSRSCTDLDYSQEKADSSKTSKIMTYGVHATTNPQIIQMVEKYLGRENLCIRKVAGITIEISKTFRV